eukprot:7057675-Alexandrium_andersonii.AAC.1
MTETAIVPNACCIASWPSASLVIAVARVTGSGRPSSELDAAPRCLARLGCWTPGRGMNAILLPHARQK